MYKKETKVVPPALQKVEVAKEDNIKVVVRSRPLSSEEKNAGTPSLVTCDQDRQEVSVAMNLGSKRSSKKYTYDMVFGPYSTQNEVYTNAIKPVVDEVLLGYNCTVFAYGQTGTGKTFTMEGDVDSQEMMGMIPRAVRTIFEALETMDNSEYTVKVSFLELYNEELQDLLSATDDVKLRILDDKSKMSTGVSCHNLEEIMVNNKEEICNIMKQAMAKRQVGETKLNKASSRSHCIFTMTVHMRETTPEGEDLLKIGKLNLVDLAGSECIGRSGATNIRAREAGNINKSLLTLGRVISALVEKTPHIPYRDSKLTRLLQESLGGRAKTCIIATVAPSVQCLDETLSTLDYASRAKFIKNKPEANQRMTKRAVLKEYAEDLERLRQELACARAKDGVFLTEDRYNEMMQNLESQKNQIEELEEAMEHRLQEMNKIQETLDEVQDKLDETERILEETREVLEQTKVELEETKEELEETKIVVEETKVLVAEHEKTEGMLQVQAKSLQNTLDEAKVDCKSLHGKVERMQQVEKVNRNAADSYHSDSTTALTDVSKQTVSFCEGQVRHHESIFLALDNMKNDHMEKATAVESAVKGFAKDSIQNVERMAKEAVPTMCTKATGQWAQLEAHAEKHCTETVAELKSAHQQVDAPLQNIVHEILHEQEKTLAKHAEHIASALKTSQQEIQEFSTAQTERLDTISNQIGADAEQSRKAVEYHQQMVADFVNTERERIEQATALLTKQFTDLLNGFKMEAQSKLDHVLSTTTDMCKSTIETSIRSECATKKTVQDAVNETKEWTDKVMDHTTRLIEQNAQDNVALVDITNQTRSKTSESSQLLEKNVHDLTNRAQSEKQTVLDMAEVAKNELKEETAKVETLGIESVGAVERNEISVNSKLHIVSDTVQEWADVRKTEVQQQRKTVEAFREDASTQFTDMQTRCDNYVQKEITTDKSKEPVPERKPYAYNPTIPKTLPHEEILQQYRDAKAANGGVPPESITFGTATYVPSTAEQSREIPPPAPVTKEDEEENLAIVNDEEEQKYHDENAAAAQQQETLSRKHSTESMKRTELGEIGNTLDNKFDDEQHVAKKKQSLESSASDEPPEAVDCLTEEIIMDMKVAQLRKELAAKKLSQLGNKKTLQQRLIDNLQ